MIDKYILRGHEAVPEGNLFTWGQWMEHSVAERTVGHEQIGDYEISTMFFGLEMTLHRLFNLDARPHLFETMVFSGFNRAGKIVAQERCSTWDEAVDMHSRMVARIAQMISG